MSSLISQKQTKKSLTFLGLYCRQERKVAVKAKVLEGGFVVLDVRPTHPIMERVWDKAIVAQKRIVLPEANDERTLIAADLISKHKLAQVTLLGNPDQIRQLAKSCNADVDNLNIVDPHNFPAIDNYAEKLFELRKGKVKSVEEAKNLLDSHLYFGAMYVKLGEADGMVAGACNTTADVLRPAYQIVKTAPGISLASAYFAMIIPDCPFGEDGFVLYADAGGVPDPNPEELAEIAITSCLTMKNIFGVEEPRAAMLSYSTKGSASHPLVDKVVEATNIANQKRPDLMIDGEMQGDTALVPEIGKKKAPNSPVAGKANILVFPDLNSGNIAYKLTERLAGAEAYGPLMQGLDKPVNDLSRGCKPTDIVNVAAIVAVKAQVPYGIV